MYFGTVARLHIRSGLLDDFMAYSEQRNQEAPEGGVAMIAYQSADDPNEFYLALVAEDEETYRAINDSPEQTQEFQRMMEYLDEEPEMHDGYVIFSQFPQTARR